MIKFVVFPVEYQWYTVTSGKLVEITGKIWWFYKFYIGGISVVLPLVSSATCIPMETSGKIWWYMYHHCYQLI